MLRIITSLLIVPIFCYAADNDSISRGFGDPFLNQIAAISGQIKKIKTYGNSEEVFVMKLTDDSSRFFAHRLEYNNGTKHETFVCYRGVAKKKPDEKPDLNEEGSTKPCQNVCADGKGLDQTNLTRAEYEFFRALFLARLEEQAKKELADQETKQAPIEAEPEPVKKDTRKSFFWQWSRKK